MNVISISNWLACHDVPDLVQGQVRNTTPNLPFETTLDPGGLQCLRQLDCSSVLDGKSVR
jgi:hypothetical protein